MNQKWNDHFMRMALEVASMSKDVSTKVGAVVAKGKYHVSDGYNGFIPKIPDLPEYLADREMRLALTDHAERNAIDASTQDLCNCTIYVTAPPCHECAKAIAKAGITRVVHLPGSTGLMERYAWSFKIAALIFKYYEIEVVELPA
jgi:dCMP deaminase